MICITVAFSLSGLNETFGQWSTIGNNIYNTNPGNVGIGYNSPSTLLYVGKNMTEPVITVRNLGGTAGATYSMIDNASGANWKFKATIIGGFKIRDHGNSLDPIIVEPNSAASVLYFKSGGSLGIGTSSPDNSAALDINSTTKGFLPVRMTTAEIAGISNPADGLVVYNISDHHLYQYLSNTNLWTQIPLEGLTQCGTPFTVTHYAGEVAPVTKTVTYQTVMTSLSGANKCWLKQNLGADHPAASATDATEASAGWYWQFGLPQGYKHDGTTRTPNTTWIYPVSAYWEPETDPCLQLLGIRWRVPTRNEWYNADFNGGWDNYNETYSSPLLIHAAGHLSWYDGSLGQRGEVGGYASSNAITQYTNESLRILSSDCYVYDMIDRATGQSIRCIKD